ncbi:MAG: glycosyltransferase family 4 protein [Bryobacteraceae bacterium]
MRIAFLTATPLNILEGSGTYAGISVLATGLRRLGTEIEVFAPAVPFPIFTLRRLWFNEQLRRRTWEAFDCVVGFDMDGYRIAGRSGRPHIASIKGVIADEMRFERGATRWTMALQAWCEQRHVRRADLVVTTSRYAARRIQELYGLGQPPQVVPEAIDLETWRSLFARYPAAPDPRRFTVLTVCRFYPRKRLAVLLGAAERLRGKIPGLEFRIVGDGPERARLVRIWRKKALEDTVRWLGSLPQEELVREYQSADVFCLPSVQEGFGIVFLEAMAAGKPVTAARAAASPEAVPHALLFEPENETALAAAVLELFHNADLRRQIAEEGKRWVEQFDTARVAQRFLREVTGVLGRPPAELAPTS